MNQTKQHTLEGLLYCKECGCRLGIKKDYRYENKYIINCNKYTRNPKLKLCTSHFMVYNTLEQKILENIKKICQNINQDKIIKEIEIYFEQKTKYKHKNIQKTLENQLIVLTQKLKSLYDDKFNNIIQEDTYITLVKEVEKEIKNIKKEQKQNIQLESMKINKKEINKLINKKPSNELLCLLIDRIDINKNREIEIKYKFSCPNKKTS